MKVFPICLGRIHHQDTGETPSHHILAVPNYAFWMKTTGGEDLIVPVVVHCTGSQGHRGDFSPASSYWYWYLRQWDTVLADLRRVIIDDAKNIEL